MLLKGSQKMLYVIKRNLLFSQLAVDLMMNDNPISFKVTKYAYFWMILISHCFWVDYDVFRYNLTFKYDQQNFFLKTSIIKTLDF